MLLKKYDVHWWSQAEETWKSAGGSDDLRVALKIMSDMAEVFKTDQVKLVWNVNAHKVVDTVDSTR